MSGDFRRGTKVRNTDFEFIIEVTQLKACRIRKGPRTPAWNKWEDKGKKNFCISLPKLGKGKENLGKLHKIRTNRKRLFLRPEGEKNPWIKIKQNF